MFKNIFVQSNKLYLSIIFFSFIFFLFLININLVSAATPRLEQLAKNIQSNQPLSITSGARQILSCSDLSGQIEKLTLSMLRWDNTTFGQFQASFVGGVGPDRLSDVITIAASPSRTQNDIMFTFDPAIDVDSDLCANGGSVEFRVKSLNNSISYLYGTNNVDAYPNGRATLYPGAASYTPLDLYFIVNGVAEVNHPPILLPIGNKTIDEGKLLKVSLASTDQDQFGESIYTLTGLPEHSVFDGKNFYWTPGFDQSGTYSIVFTATDAGNTALSAQIDSETIVVTVNNANPILNRLEQLAKNIQSNQPLSITSGARQILSCSDLSGQIEKLTLSMLRWDNTTFGQFQASFVGGVGPDRLSDVITIAASPSRTQNDIMFTFDPAIDVDSDLCANGGSVEFRVKSLNNSISYLYGTNNVDAYPNGRATLYPGAASYTPLDLYFIVNEHANTNQSPTIINLSTQSIMEDNNFTFTLQATDPDNDPLVYSGSNLPTGATLNPATGEFSWTPNYNDAGTYVVEFSVSDGDLSATTSTTIEVLNTNRAPVLESIGNQTTSENQTLSFTVNASDEDNDTVTYSATNLPPGATFNQLTRTFSWTPAFNQSGNYENIEFTVTDNSSPMELDVELITITVGDVNRAPVFISPGTQEVLENNQLQFTVSASDPDNDTATVSATNLPSGATFNATTLQFSWIPTLAQEGIYTVTFIATDNGIPIETSAIDVVITVGDNPTPVEQAEDIIDTVTTFNLPNNVENSYMANLQKVGTFIEAGNTQATISQLTAFINKVNQDYNQNKITLQVKNTLVSLAEGLIGDLE